MPGRTGGLGFAGLAPLALGFGSGAEIQRPLAVAVIGGLAVSTSVSLLVLPSLVRLIHDNELTSMNRTGPSASPLQSTSRHLR